MLTSEFSEMLHNLRKLNLEVDENDYDFLLKTPELYKPILIGLGGSHAYGTNVETSDLDIRGIALHTKQDILLVTGFDQVVNEKTDTTIYSLRKIVNLLINCNPNTIEILGLIPEHYVFINDIGKKLIENRDMFLSMRCLNSFLGYANAQMYRLQQKTLVAMTDAELNSHIVKTLNHMKETMRDKFEVDGFDAKLKDGKIVFDINVTDFPAEKVSGILGEFNSTLREYEKKSKRNEQALAHNKIAKHAMHLLRLYMMCLDILLYGQINTYRKKEHDLLMSIRNGDYLGEDGKPNQEFFDIVHEYEAKIDYAKDHAVIPKKPDIDRINKFVAEINESIVTGN